MKSLKGKVVVKKGLREGKRATIVLNRPAPLLSKLQKDTKRFFKDEIEDERKSLYFA